MAEKMLKGAIHPNKYNQVQKGSSEWYRTIMVLFVFPSFDRKIVKRTIFWAVHIGHYSDEQCRDIMALLFLCIFIKCYCHGHSTDVYLFFCFSSKSCFLSPQCFITRSTDYQSIWCPEQIHWRVWQSSESPHRSLVSIFSYFKVAGHQIGLVMCNVCYCSIIL